MVAAMIPDIAAEAMERGSMMTESSIWSYSPTNAWLYMRYCKASFCSEWQAQEMRARKAKVGLWSGKTAMEPWNWQKAKKNR